MKADREAGLARQKAELEKQRKALDDERRKREAEEMAKLEEVCTTTTTPITSLCLHFLCVL